MKKLSFIFDMDGVLIDSMRYHCKAWKQAAEEFGLSLSDEDIYLREGEKGDLSLKYFMKINGLDSSEEIISKILARKEDIFSKLPSPDIYPDIPKILEYLDNKNYQMAIVTGTSISELKKILPDTISKYFSIKITGDQLKYGKPHPEPYQLALNKLQVSPSEAIVIENAPYGIRSAKEAGLFCIAVCTSLSSKHLQQSDLILDSSKKLFNYIKQNY